MRDFDHNGGGGGGGSGGSFEERATKAIIHLAETGTANAQATDVMMEKVLTILAAQARVIDDLRSRLERVESGFDVRRAAEPLKDSDK